VVYIVFARFSFSEFEMLITIELYSYIQSSTDIVVDGVLIYYHNDIENVKFCDV